MTAIELNPGLLVILAGVVMGFLPRQPRQIVSIAAPLLGILILCLTPIGSTSIVSVFGFDLTLLRLDALAFPFALIFLIAAMLNSIYALHQDEKMQDSAALIYAGAAIGAVLAGDFATLFIYWELTAISSVFVILATGTKRAYDASMRYLIWQIGSGVLLLGGIIILANETGSMAFGEIELGSAASWMIFIAFGIKCAFPLLHNWLPDAYPEATGTGTVVLSAFTTKLAIYAFARSFAGESLLIPIGAVMSCFPIFFAVIENDLRRALAFSLNTQLGFMLVGIGIGSELAINGAVSHAFASTLYQGLLFMSIGAVLHRVGTVQASKLGGLYKSMPWTTVFCIIGALSIAGFPLTSGFVTKNLTLVAVENAHYLLIWLMLIFASVGVIGHSGIKIPYFAFFGQDGGHRVQEAPKNMLAAMGIAAFACIFIGVFPSTLYSIMPYPVTKDPYTVQSVITKTQLLFFAVLAFSVLIKTGLYPKEIPSTNLNTDWLYRRFGAHVLYLASKVARWAWGGVAFGWRWLVSTIQRFASELYGPGGAMGRSWATGQMAFWATAMIAGYSLIGFFYLK